MHIFHNNRFNINADTGLYCIFGRPVKHSLSPAMQNAAFRKTGINAVYTAFEASGIKAAISAMKTLNIKGASVTIPFKTEAMKYADEIDPLAGEIGALNTLVNKNGKIYAYNTDGSGAAEALVNNDVKIKGSRVLVIGNGGSARAVAFTLLGRGAKITIAGRDRQRFMPLVRGLEKKGPADSILISTIDLPFMQDIDIIINTTPVGMSPDTGSSPLKENLILEKHTVFDIIYAPHNTKLLRISRARGCKTIHGTEMLVYQGAMQFELWTGIKAPFQIMLKALKAAIRKDQQQQ